MMKKSNEFARALSMSGIYISSLVRLLNSTKEAIVLRSLLNMLLLLHKNHPRPRQLVLDNDLYNLVKRFAESEGQVLVSQLATSILVEFQTSTFT